MLKIYFAGDHAGFELKNALIESVREAGHEAFDLGPHTLDSADDYPDYVTPCAQKVSDEPGAFGIIIGASGEGEAMAANRVKGTRAAEWYGGSLDIIRLSREHNDANILSLGARFVSADEAGEAVHTFLTTPFSGAERHLRRIAKF